MRKDKAEPATPARHRQPPLQRISYQRVPRELSHFRTGVAFALIRRLYCEVVPLWLGCGRGSCRRHRRCCGNGDACLDRAWKLLPEAQKVRVYADVVRGGPRRIPAKTDQEQHLRRHPLPPAWR